MLFRYTYQDDAMRFYLLLILLFSHPIFAMNAPTTCPSTTSIQYDGVDQYAQDPNNAKTWAVAHKNSHYNTKQNWSFMILAENTKDRNDAFRKAEKALNSLHHPIGPKKMKNTDVWTCYYENDYHYTAVAVTPPVSMQGYQTRK